MNFFSNIRNKISLLAEFIQNKFVYILFITYFCSVFIPNLGVYINNLSFGYLKTGDEHGFNVTIPMILLGIIVLNAALSISIKELLKIHKHLLIITLAIGANILLGILFLFAVKPLAIFIPENFMQQIIIAIALLTSVPIAGSAAAWTQNIRGNVLLTLEILIITTIISPFIAPLILTFFSNFTIGEFTTKLINLADHGVGYFLAAIVVLPSIIGLMFNYILNADVVDYLKPFMKLVNQACLMILIYANSAFVLPKLILKNDNMLMLVLCFIIAFAYCLLTYLLGWFISISYKSSVRDEISLMISEGMKNVGAALILATTGFPEYKYIGLVIIFFAIVQQFLASYVKTFEYQKLKFIKNNHTKLSCFMNPKCDDWKDK